MATIASDFGMHALQRESRHRMGAKADAPWQPQPSNVGVTPLALVSKLGLVNLRMACDTIRAHGRGLCIALVVTGRALRLCMTASEAQAGMIASDIRDLAPVGFVVARSACSLGKPASMRVFVTGCAIGLQAEKRRMTAPVLAIVAIATSNRCVSPLERPTRLAMVEALRSAPRPSDELGIPSQVFDVALAAILASIFATMQTCTFSYPSTQVVVATKTGVGIEALAGGMTFVAFRVAFQVGVGVAQLAR
jgi:hypothetical protein